MLQINHRQMAAFAARADAALEVSVGTFLTEVLPARVAALAPEDLATLARACLARADRLGIDRSDDIHRLASFMLLFGEAFEMRPEFGGELDRFRSPDLPWWYKFDRLHRCVAEKE